LFDKRVADALKALEYAGERVAFERVSFGGHQNVERTVVVNDSHQICLA